MSFQVVIAVFFVTIFLQPKGFAKSIKCQKEAESIAQSESKKKGNLPDDLLLVAHPTEFVDGNVEVYIGARAHYNYFKMKFDKKCKLVKIIEAEYAD